VQILQSLGTRRTEIDARAKELDTRAELAAAAEKRIEERVAELKRLEAHIQGLLVQVDDAQDKRIASLVDVYQRMRAKDAAAVFDALDDDVLVQVASRMKQASLAEILGKMTPARARELTRLLAADRSREAKTVPAAGAAAKRS
jgi:flagellar motility protein MotE (MotC chaperone)